ncbi:MAG: DUF4203 domain-containing protein [Anaerolineaceae bacterium]
MLTIPLLFTGSALVLFGRKLYWLVVGLLGFIGGLLLVNKLFDGMNGTTQMLIALGIGVLGAAFTLLIQKVALSVAGFAAGGYIALSGIRLLNLDIGNWSWILIVACGLLGILLVVRIFGWALTLLSSLCGAMIIVQTINLDGVMAIITVGVIFLFGVLVQSAILRKGKKTG